MLNIAIKLISKLDIPKTFREKLSEKLYSAKFIHIMKRKHLDGLYFSSVMTQGEVSKALYIKKVHHAIKTVTESNKVTISDCN